MRFMDGLMAIPAILLALALVSLFRAGVGIVIVAIVVPELPRVARLVRSIVLSMREEPYVEAAVVSGTPTPLLLIRHVLPNTLPPLIVQGTYICASAILIEAILSFLGVGLPPETPSWGNIMAEGRSLFRMYPHNTFFPGIFLALTVLAVNVLGDGLRDLLDPQACASGAIVPAAKPVLDIQGLTVQLPIGSDRSFAVENVSLSVDAGEIVCVVGESGSGKSVTALLGHGPATAGAGADARADSAGWRRPLDAEPGRAAGTARPPHGDGVPGADDRAQSGDARSATQIAEVLEPYPPRRASAAQPRARHR